MLRWAIPFLLATVVIGPALAADQAVPRRDRYVARTNLPAGLPHANYRYRTTVIYRALRRRRFTSIAMCCSRRIRSCRWSVDQGPYYGGPSTVSYWDRVPYACGVYGYC